MGLQQVLHLQFRFLRKSNYYKAVCCLQEMCAKGKDKDRLKANDEKVITCKQ